MKILVAGGAGYIGSHVTRALLDDGKTVTVFDNLSTGLRQNLFAEAEFIEGDIMEPASLARTMRGGFDGLVHLAALKAAGESMVKPEAYARNNIAGSINILNAALEAGVRHVVFSSSAAVYGEPEYNPIDEKHPRRPINFYGYTKLQIEGLFDWYHRLRGMNFFSLRYFNAAGYDADGRVTGLERHPANLLPIIMEVAVGKRPSLQVFGDDYPTPDGTCLRDYVHVTDLADAHVRAFHYLSEHGGNHAVNLGSEKGMSVLEMLEAARRVTGKTIPHQVTGRRPGDPAVLYASSALARKTLGWRARMSDVDTLVTTTWRMYQTEGNA